MPRKSKLIEVLSINTRVPYTGTIVEKNQYIKNDALVGYRSDARKLPQILADGFFPSMKTFEVWQTCLQLDSKQSVWQAFPQKHPATPGSLHSELSEIHLRTLDKVTDLAATTCVNLTYDHFIAPKFPYFEENDSQKYTGIRYLYAVHVDSYFDAFSYEKKLNPKSKVLPYQEFAVQDIPQGHVLAALKVEVTLNKSNKIKYNHCSENIIWNVDAIDEQGRSYLRGIPHYFKKREQIEADFGKILNSASMEIYIPADGKSVKVQSKKATATITQPENISETNNNNITARTVGKIKKEDIANLENQLNTVGFFKRQPKTWMPQDPLKQFKKSIEEELLRQATHPKTGQIDPQLKQYAMETIEKIKGYTPKESYDYCMNLAQDLFKLFKIQQQKGFNIDAQNLWDGYKNTLIIAEELRTSFSSEIGSPKLFHR